MKNSSKSGRLNHKALGDHHVDHNHYMSEITDMEFGANVWFISKCSYTKRTITHKLGMPDIMGNVSVSAIFADTTDILFADRACSFCNIDVGITTFLEQKPKVRDEFKERLFPF